MILTDYHVHSNFSFDCDTDMETMIRRALTLGLTELAITDHQDYLPGGLSDDFSIDFAAYLDTFTRMKERYADKINLLLGIEIGLMPAFGREIENLLARYPFDFVIGSTHDPLEAAYYLGTFFEGKSKLAAYSEYFQQTLENLRSTDGYDVYGHLDYISRYGIYADNSLLYSDYSDIIDEILKELITRGKGLELNTSGYRYGLNTVNPQTVILKRYRELGGEIITVGSDAHAAEHIAEHFDRAEAVLRGCGFTAYTRFRGRKPVWTDI